MHADDQYRAAKDGAFPHAFAKCTENAAAVNGKEVTAGPGVADFSDQRHTRSKAKDQANFQGRPRRTGGKDGIEGLRFVPVEAWACSLNVPSAPHLAAVRGDRKAWPRLKDGGAGH